MNYPLGKMLRTGIERRIHQLEPKAVLDPADFTWATEVEKYFPIIRREVEGILPNLDKVINFDEVLPNQRALYQKDLWKSYFLVALGSDVKSHQAQCPESTKALTHIPHLINAFFSVLKPGTHIPPHRGPYAGIIRYHLGVIIPEGDVGIRVDKEVCRWEEGKSLFFDDSFEHEAWNRSQSLRVILFVDFERPLPRPLTYFNKLTLGAFKFSKTVRLAQAKVQGRQLSPEF